jgi:hypothetical protein
MKNVTLMHRDLLRTGGIGFRRIVHDSIERCDFCGSGEGQDEPTRGLHQT